MITCGNDWNETFKLYASEKIPRDVFYWIGRIIVGYDVESFYEMIALANNKWTNSDNYLNYFGGNVFLCETLEDLNEIKTTEESEKDPSKWASILEKADGFDDCRDIGNHIVFFMACNDSGGNTYFVPKRFIKDCPNIEQCIKLTDEMWRACEDNKN